MDCDNCNDTIQATNLRGVKICEGCADRIGRERLALIKGMKVKSLRALQDGRIYDLMARPDDYVIEVTRSEDKSGATIWNYNVVCWDLTVPGMEHNRHLLGMGLNYIAVSSSPYHVDALVAAMDAVRTHQERRKSPTPEDKAEVESWRRMGAPLLIRI